MIENIIEFAIFSLYAFCLYVILYSKTKDFLNPFGIPVFSFIFSFAISRLRLNPLQSTLSFKTYLIVILVSMLIFFIGIVSINSIKTKQYPKKPENPEVTFRFKYAFRMIFFLTTICFFLTLFEVKFYDFSFLYSDVADKKTIIDFESSIRIIRYLTNLLPYCAIYAFFEILFDKNKTKLTTLFNIVVISFALFFSMFILMSRGTLLIILLGFLYLYNQKKRIDLNKLFIISVLLISILTIMISIRLTPKSAVFKGELSLPFFNSIYNYLVFSFDNFNQLVIKGSPYTIFRSVHISLSKLLNIYNMDEVIQYTTSFFNTTTFIYYFFHDLGIIGVITYTIVIFSLIGLLYVQINSGKSYLVLVLAVYQKALFMVFFGNYFFGNFSISNAYYITIILVLFSYTFPWKKHIKN